MAGEILESTMSFQSVPLMAGFFVAARLEPAQHDSRRVVRHGLGEEDVLLIQRELLRVAEEVTQLLEVAANPQSLGPDIGHRVPRGKSGDARGDDEAVREHAGRPEHLLEIGARVGALAEDPEADECIHSCFLAYGMESWLMNWPRYVSTFMPCFFSLHITYVSE